MNNHWTRVILGIVFAAVVAGLLWLDWYLRHALPAGLVLMVPLAALIGLATVEAVRLCRAAGADPSMPWTVLSSMAVVVFGWLALTDRSGGSVGLWIMLLVLAMLAPPFIREGFRRDLTNALPSIAASVFCVVYAGLMGFLILFIGVGFTAAWLAVFIASAKLTDVGAYLVGRQFGRHKLAPVISPKKTVEGAIGGLVFGVAAAWLGVGIIRSLVGPSLGVLGYPKGLVAGTIAVLLFGLVVSVAAQLSDLAESILKRSAKLKDSATSVPGFGGVLDLVDSLLLSAPVAVLYLVVIYWVRYSAGGL